MMHRIGGAVSLLTCSLLAACGSGDPDVADAAWLDAQLEDVAHVQAAVVNATESPPFAGVVAVVVAGQSNVHTGIQLNDRLVLTSSAWLDWQTRPANVTLRFGAGNRASGTALGPRHVNSSAYFPAAIIQMDSLPVAGRPAVDTRTGPQLLGAVLRCFEFESSSILRAVDVSVTAQNGNTLSAEPTLLEPGDLQNVDLGAPCIDLVTHTVVGFLSAQAGSVSTIYRLHAMQPWLDGMSHLAGVRARAANAGPLALYNTPDGGATRFCLDIPWGSPYSHVALNQYPCHYGPAQRFWLDFSIDANNPRIVSDSSGLCVDLPNAVSTNGDNLQQYPCHAGTNQRFEMSLWPTAPTGIKFRPLHARSQDRCLSIEGGPSNVNGPVPAEQRSCAANVATNTDQRWYMSFR